MKSKGDVRLEVREERNQRAIDMLKQGRPVPAICKILGMEKETGRRICNDLIEKHGIDYQPQSFEEKLPADTHLLRHNLSTALYNHREINHWGLISMQTGLTNRQQHQAIDRPYTHDWSISQISRLANAQGEDFKVFMLKALLSRTEFEKVSRCLNI